MENTLQVVLSSVDSAVVEEFRQAMAAIPGRPSVVHTCKSNQEALEFAISRGCQVVCVPLPPPHERGDLRAFVAEMKRLAPGATTVAYYDPARLAERSLDSSEVIELFRSHVGDLLRRPFASSEIRQLFDRMFNNHAADGSARAPVVSFISNKGGVGKSTISVNVACELARTNPGRVLLIDASLQMGTCALMLALQPAATIADAVREKDRLDETLLRQIAVSHECGLDLLAAPEDALAASIVDDSSLSRVIQVARRAYDYVIIDTFPVLDASVISILDSSNLACVVLSGMVPSLAGTIRLLPLLGEIGFPRSRTRILLNRNMDSFPSNLTQSQIEEQLGTEIDLTFPYQRRMLMATNLGEPLILGMRRWFQFGQNTLGTEIDLTFLFHGRMRMATNLGDLLILGIRRWFQFGRNIGRLCHEIRGLRLADVSAPQRLLGARIEPISKVK